MCRKMEVQCEHNISKLFCGILFHHRIHQLRQRKKAYTVVMQCMWRADYLLCVFDATRNARSAMLPTNVSFGVIFTLRQQMAYHILRADNSHCMTRTSRGNGREHINTLIIKHH